MSLTKTTILFGSKLNEDVLKCNVECFIATVEEVCCRLEIVPHWLMAVMELETAGTFSPGITNSLGYTGLIQFGKAAATEVGTTQDKLREMDACTQMRYVERYLSKFRGSMNSLADVYLAVFFPVAIGKPDGWVLETSRLSAERIAKWNPGFDINKDKKIQVYEVKRKLLQRLPKNYHWINS